MDKYGIALSWLFNNNKKLGNLEKVRERSIVLHRNNSQLALQMDDRLFLTLCARELRLGEILNSNYFHEVFKMDKVDCYSDWWKFLGILKRLIEFAAQYGSWYKTAGTTPYIRLTPDLFEDRVKTFLLQLLRHCKFGKDFNREILQTLNNLQLKEVLNTLQAILTDYESRKRKAPTMHLNSNTNKTTTTNDAHSGKGQSSGNR